MLAAEHSPDVSPLASATAAYDWGRAIAIAAEQQRAQTGADWFVSQVQTADFYCQSGQWATARATIAKAWEFAQQQKLELSDFDLLRFALVAELLGEVGLADLAAKRVRDPLVEPYSSDVLAQRLGMAVENETALAGNPTRVIPMGQDCLPYNILMRWGFKDVTVEGPFTAGVYMGNCVTLALRDNFGGLVDPNAYRIIRSPGGIDTPINSRYNLALNHEVGPFFCVQPLSALTDLYTRRANNFCVALQPGNRVLFLASRSSLSEIPELWQAIVDMYPLVNFRLLVVDYENGEEEEIQLPLDARLRVLSSPFPSTDYVWFRAEWVNSAAGLSWEAAIMAAVKEEMQQDQCG